jgi:hypothetical protein
VRILRPSTMRSVAIQCGLSGIGVSLNAGRVGQFGASATLNGCPRITVWASTGLTDIHPPGAQPQRMSTMETMERKKPRARRSFTPEFKAEIVELCHRGHRSIGQVARDFDLTENGLRTWCRSAVRREHRSRRAVATSPGR